jgi:hypothetical protein
LDDDGRDDEAATTTTTAASTTACALLSVYPCRLNADLFFCGTPFESLVESTRDPSRMNKPTPVAKSNQIFYGLGSTTLRPASTFLTPFLAFLSLD